MQHLLILPHRYSHSSAHRLSCTSAWHVKACQLAVVQPKGTSPGICKCSIVSDSLLTTLSGHYSPQGHAYIIVSSQTRHQAAKQLCRLALWPSLIIFDAACRARVAGADAALLIAAVLPNKDLGYLTKAARKVFIHAPCSSFSDNLTACDEFLAPRCMTGSFEMPGQQQAGVVSSHGASWSQYPLVYTSLLAYVWDSSYLFCLSLAHNCSAEDLLSVDHSGDCNSC